MWNWARWPVVTVDGILGGAISLLDGRGLGFRRGFAVGVSCVEWSLRGSRYPAGAHTVAVSLRLDCAAARTVANNGSFFANPIITDAEFVQFNADNPDAPHWPADDNSVKLSAAWLIEHAGFKDFHDTATGMATWAKQPLVLVNEHATSTADLLAFKKTLVEAVQQKFHVTLAQEPELLP